MSISLNRRESLVSADPLQDRQIDHRDRVEKKVRSFRDTTSCRSRAQVPQFPKIFGALQIAFDNDNYRK
jgi:hypothetical protein